MDPEDDILEAYRAPAPAEANPGAYDGYMVQNPQTGERLVWRVAATGRGRWVSTRAIAAQNPEVLNAREMADQAASMLPDLQRFQELNRVQETGSIPQRLGGWFGIPQLFPDTEEDEMRAITDRLAPRMRQPGSGASSDRDVRMFVSALPNLTRGGRANDQVIASLRQNAGLQQQYAAYVDRFAQEHGGTSGMDTFEAFARRQRATPQQTRRPGQARTQARTRYDANGNPVR